MSVAKMNRTFRYGIVSAVAMGAMFSFPAMAQQSNKERDASPFLASKTQCLSEEDASKLSKGYETVSYTHLTLPTICSV